MSYRIRSTNCAGLCAYPVVFIPKLLVIQGLEILIKDFECVKCIDSIKQLCEEMETFPSVMEQEARLMTFSAFGLLISSSLTSRLFNSPSDTVSDGNPPSSHFTSADARPQPSLSSPSLLTAGSRWLLVNSVLYSPLQFNSHCSSNWKGERRACRRMNVCVQWWWWWVFVRIEDISSIQIHPHMPKTHKEIHIHEQSLGWWKPLTGSVSV